MSRMLDINSEIVFAPGVRMVPIEELQESVRVQMLATVKDARYVLCRQGGRHSCKALDASAAGVLVHFEVPIRLCDVICAHAERLRVNPDTLVEDVYSFIAKVFAQGFLCHNAVEEGQYETAPGDTLAGYRVEAVVQRLEDTEVCRATDSHGARVAIKLARSVKSSLRVAWEREARITSMLPEGLGPRLLFSGAHGSPPLLVLDWIDGMPLDVAAAQRRCSRDAMRDLLTLATRVVRCYARLHEAGFVHGDVHPGNILVSDEGKVFVIDFGATVCPENSTFGKPRNAGMLQYIAPETADSLLKSGQHGKATFVSEQYSVAVVVF